MSISFFRPTVPEITVEQLKAIRDQNEEHILIDVRQPEERDIASIGGENIPLPNLAEALDDLNDYRNTKIIVYCRTGARSEMAAAFLKSMGFQDVYNLEGGIYAWSTRIDSSVQTY